MYTYQVEAIHIYTWNDTHLQVQQIEAIRTLHLMTHAYQHIIYELQLYTKQENKYIINGITVCPFPSKCGIEARTTPTHIEN